jgi:2'-5' RNA ligase
MQDGSRLRCFVALDLSAAVRTALEELLGVLRPAVRDVRWVPAENLHMTLKFLGPIGTSRVADVRAVLDVVAGACEPFVVTVSNLGCFPSPRRPRVVWVGLDGAELRPLWIRLEAALADAGFPREARAFAAHVTLGRARGGGGADTLRDVLERHRQRTFGASRIEEIVLYRSELLPHGARYTPLHRVRLGAGAPAGDDGSGASMDDERSRKTPGPGLVSETLADVGE